MLIMDKRRNIKVQEKTYHALKSIGQFGETYDDIIWRLYKGNTKRSKKTGVNKTSGYDHKLG